MKIKPFSLLPSLADVFFVVVFLIGISAYGVTLLGDGDTGYHIRAGEYILATHSIPHQDIFSLHTPPIDWTAHEWLSEVIMALLYKLKGLTTVVLFYILLFSFFCAQLFNIIKKESNIIVAVLICFLSIATARIHWLARPHMFSLVLMLFWYSQLDVYNAVRNKKILYFFPPLILLWVNLHGGFILGLILLLIYVVGNWGSFLISSGNGRREFKEKALFLSSIFIICVGISMLNPSGYKALLFPFQLQSEKYLMNNVIEFLSPNFHEPIFFKYYLYFMVAILAMSRKSLSNIELMIVILAVHMSLFASRHATVYAVLVAPILARQIVFFLEEQKSQGWVRRIINSNNNISKIENGTTPYLWAALFSFLIITGSLLGKLTYEFNAKLKPVQAVHFLEKETIPGNVFNNDEFGDYLIYKDWKKYKPFIDGRLDMYGEKIVKQYKEVTGLGQGWKGVLDYYDINWIFFDTNSALSTFLSQNSDWRLIYSDKVASIFVKNIPLNAALIQKYQQVKLFSSP